MRTFNLVSEKKQNSQRKEKRITQILEYLEKLDYEKIDLIFQIVIRLL